MTDDLVSLYGFSVGDKVYYNEFDQDHGEVTGFYNKKYLVVRWYNTELSGHYTPVFLNHVVPRKTPKEMADEYYLLRQKIVGLHDALKALGFKMECTDDRTNWKVALMFPDRSYRFVKTIPEVKEIV